MGLRALKDKPKVSLIVSMGMRHGISHWAAMQRDNWHSPFSGVTRSPAKGRLGNDGLKKFYRISGRVLYKALFYSYAFNDVGTKTHIFLL